MKTIFVGILLAIFSVGIAGAADKPLSPKGKPQISKRQKLEYCDCANNIGAPVMCVPKGSCISPNYCLRKC